MKYSLQSLKLAVEKAIYVANFAIPKVIIVGLWMIPVLLAIIVGWFYFLLRAELAGR